MNCREQICCSLLLRHSEWPRLEGSDPISLFIINTASHHRVRFLSIISELTASHYHVRFISVISQLTASHHRVRVISVISQLTASHYRPSHFSHQSTHCIILPCPIHFSHQSTHCITSPCPTLYSAPYIITQKCLRILLIGSSQSLLPHFSLFWPCTVRHCTSIPRMLTAEIKR